MGRTVRVTLSLHDRAAAEFISDLDTPPALAGGLLAEVVTCSQSWHIGPPWPGEDAAPVGVVLLLPNRRADVLLDGSPDAQGDILRRTLWRDGWLFVGAEAAATLWPAVAPQAVTLDTMRRAENSAAEWTAPVALPASARYDLRRVAVN